jgi:hypothetical protein
MKKLYKVLSKFNRGFSQKKPVFHSVYLFIIIIFITFSQLSCSVYETFVNISRLKFKLDNVSGFTLSGVSLSNKTRIEDFTPVEVLKISGDFAQGKLPVSFILNVDAKNPNDGTGGYPKTNATLKNFPWRLAIDNVETISGDIASPVTVPGTGESANIPLTIGLDLMQFFSEKGYDSLLRLALNIGGYSGGASNLALFAKPTVTTSLGDIKYPEEIKIVDFQYSN